MFKYQVTFEGDSMFDYPAPKGDANTIPQMVKKKLGPKWNLSDVTMAGETIEQVALSVTWEVYPTYKATNLRNEFVVWAGTNDGPLGETATLAVAEYQAYLIPILAQGWRMTVLGLLPHNINFGNPAWTPDEPTYRHDFNAAMQAWCSQHNARFLDPAQDARLANNADTTYYVDGLHLTPAGKQIVADQLYNLLR